MVITTAPGEAGQVDYGSGPMVRDPHSGRYRRTRLFAFTLGYSRKSVRLVPRLRRHRTARPSIPGNRTSTLLIGTNPSRLRGMGFTP